MSRAAEDQYTWETRGRQAKDLLAEMLKSRLEAQELVKQHNIKPAHKPSAAKLEDGGAALAAVPEELPDEVR